MILAGIQKSEGAEVRTPVTEEALKARGATRLPAVKPGAVAFCNGWPFGGFSSLPEFDYHPVGPRADVLRGQAQSAVATEQPGFQIQHAAVGQKPHCAKKMGQLQEEARLRRTLANAGKDRLQHQRGGRKFATRHPGTLGPVGSDSS